jgi:ABC-type cobalamin/Fe3+-siderophores transport system ATPase subunit
MRLRYLHVRDCPPLDDVRVVFGQETILKREYAINFVVGINGTGKSTLLRALYTVIRRLDESELPPFPVTLVYDMGSRDNARTVLFHHPGEGKAKAFFYVTPVGSWPDQDAEGWQRYAETVSSKSKEQTFVSAEDFQGNNLLREFLPKRLLAYTSGTVEEWHKIERPVFPESELPESPEKELPEERPAGWTTQQELLRGMEEAVLTTESGEKIVDEGGHALAIESTPLRMSSLGRCRLVTPMETKLAGLAFGIWHAYMEFRGVGDTDSRDRARRSPLLGHSEDQIGSARSLMDKVDWLWPTHLVLTLKTDIPQMIEERQAQLLCLLCLAEAGVKQPLDRARVVVPISRVGKFDISDRLGNLFPAGQPETVKRFADSVGDAPNGAEALCRLFALQPHLWATFETLHQWHQEGLLEEATLSIRQMKSDGVIVYESLSDGEQMLLGRMALLFLLQQQEDSLLFLDEPETHFNDFWKREIVDLIDRNLTDTTAQVLVATHTSIALTDVFRSEITVLRKDADNGRVVAQAPKHPTFGATPSDIMRNIFDAPQSVGNRASELLNRLLVLVAYADRVQAVWERLPNPQIADSSEMKALLQVLGTHKNLFAAGSAEAVLACLNELRGTPREPNAVPGKFLDKVRRLERELGAGHYQFELGRRLEVTQGA